MNLNIIELKSGDKLHVGTCLTVVECSTFTYHDFVFWFTSHEPQILYLNNKKCMVLKRINFLVRFGQIDTHES